MTAQTANENLPETSLKIPLPSLTCGSLPEINRSAIENSCIETSALTVSTPAYAIIDRQICSRKNLKIYTYKEENDNLWFYATMQGNICSFRPSGGRENRWRKGEANLTAYCNEGEYFCFNKEQPFRTMEIMLSPGYMERMACSYPDLFGKIHEQYMRRCFRQASREPVPFCPAVEKALNDLLHYESLGNAAMLYLDAKIFEILSFFLCRLEQKNSACCDCYSYRDKDMFMQAKQIVEQHYMSPPSLHGLATMVGTNECTLKKGFKTLFGVTVYGYLFNYRMEMACRYLSDSNKTIQEIAGLVGYEHPSHFSTAFRRKFNFSPAEYRLCRIKN
jgi:AraC-like DNA-binding protein